MKKKTNHSDQKVFARLKVKVSIIILDFMGLYSLLESSGM